MPEAIRSNTKIKQKNKIFIDILGAYLFLALSIVAPSTLYAIDDRLLVYSYIKKLEGKVVPEQTANQLIRSFASIGFSSKNILEEPKRNLSVFPFINYSSNLNGGNPKGALQLGNATYTSNSLLEKRSGLLAGLGANASLRSYTGYGKYIDTQGSLAISKSLESDDYILFTLVNACSKNHVKNWWFIDACAHTQNEKKEISTFEDQTVNLSFAKIADGCGLKGITVKTQEELTKTLAESCENQKKGITTFIEVILNQELGEPFRRDAMKKPVKVAGINKSDMRPQKSLNG